MLVTQGFLLLSTKNLFLWQKVEPEWNPNVLTSFKAEEPLFLSEFSLSCWGEKLLNILSSAFYVVLISITGRESTTFC